MESKRFENTEHFEEDNETVVLSIFECEYDGTQLNIYKIISNDDSSEARTLIKRQPWKDNPNNLFKNAEDAFDWFEDSILKNQG